MTHINDIMAGDIIVIYNQNSNKIEQISYCVYKDHNIYEYIAYMYSCRSGPISRKCKDGMEISKANYKDNKQFYYKHIKRKKHE